MNKFIKYGFLLVVIALLAYKSVYFQKLSDRTKNTAETFNAATYSKELWDGNMQDKIAKATELPILINAVTNNSDSAMKTYTNALAIGNYRYAMVHVRGMVSEVNDDEVKLNVPIGDSVLQLNLATEFIYGNAVRDASGLVQVKDFPNTADLNSISEELNKIIRTTVVPSFKSAVKKGDNVNVVAAIELNKEHIHWKNQELFPVRLQIIQ